MRQDTHLRFAILEIKAREGRGIEVRTAEGGSQDDIAIENGGRHHIPLRIEKR